MATALTDKLSRLVKTLSGQARITESNVTDMLREVRMALLEADVALPVVRDFIARVKDKALGQEVVGSLKPGQALVGIVNKELAATMGEGVADINLAAQPPAVILMAGLQGAGKTTTTAKLAKHLIEKRKKKVLTVSGDVYRPAAIEQLKTVTAQAGAEWFPSSPDQKPIDIARAAIDFLAGARKLDRRPGDLAHRQRRTAARVAIQLGQHNAGEWQRFAKGLGRVGRVLALHGIDHEQGLHRLQFGVQALDLGHQGVVNRQATGRVHQQHVKVVFAGVIDGRAGNVDRLLIG